MTGPDERPIDQAQLEAFARSFGQLSAAAHRLAPVGHQIIERVRAHLGVDPADIPAVGETLPSAERPNLQLAFDTLMAADPAAELIGIGSEISHYHGFSFASVFSGGFRVPIDPVSPVTDDLPVDVDETLACVTAGIWLLTVDSRPVAVGLVPGQRHGPDDPEWRLEVFAPQPEIARATLDRLADLRRAHNVYRGKVLTFSHSEYGDYGIRFLSRPATRAADVILPADDLASIERHTIGISARSAALRSAGRHLKRGLLLHGPPGSGKTHTLGYLMAAMPERTVVILQGPGVGALGRGAAIVRSLTPSMLIIEDVDLIATERGLYGMESTNPLMFQLLNEMDGLHPMDDVIFALTTNKIDVLEPALAARPGRVDHAVEIAVPDAAGRRRLLALYLEGVDHRVEASDEMAARLEGVTASFVRELVRRATFLAIEESDGPAPVTDDHLGAALAELEVHDVASSLLGRASPGPSRADR